MFDYIIIYTVGGNRTRFDRKYVQNFNELSDEKELEELLK